VSNQLNSNTDSANSTRIVENATPQTEGPTTISTERRPRPVDAEGNPIPRRPRPVDADGNPIPPRPRPVDAQGNPLPRRPRPVDADGNPIPPRPRVDADGNPLPRRPRPMDAEGKPIPPRPRVDADGNPLPRRPRPVDADGNPIPPRPRVDADGNLLPRRPRPVDADGNPIPPRPRVDVEGNPLPRRPRPVITDGNPPAPSQQTAPPKNEAAAQPAENIPRSSNPDRPAPRPITPRPVGDRPAPRPISGASRPMSDRPPRPMGDRPPRPIGDRPPRPMGDRPPRPAGAGGFRPGGGAPRLGGAPGGFRQSGPGAPRPGGAPGGFRSGSGGSPSRGGLPKPLTKTEPSKDDRKAQWSRDSQARTASKDRKDNDRKENRQGQGFDRRGNRATGPKKVKKVMPAFVAPVITQITVATEITVRDLAEKLFRSNADIIKILMKKGLMVTANQLIDFDTASHVAEQFDVLVEEYVEVDVFEQAFSAKQDDQSELVSRPPVVVVMGHVDHGKTSLLDVIRNANVQSGEAGGITQHIGAYSTVVNNKAITFLDTPGHEAFTAMRMRGAQVTDIAILVVAADDGVMPQTIEAINHANAAEVDIIVAITMMDKPSANPDRVRQQLTDHGLQPEGWGGQTITVGVSALKKEGIDTLLEMILLVSEMKELKANPKKSARGSIIEAKLDKGRGPVATVLVQEGTLRVGDPVVAGASHGKIRAMIDGHGRALKEAGPSTPVEIIGLHDVPVTGDILYTAANERQARQLSESVVAKGRETLLKSTQGKVSLDDLFNQIQAGQVKDLNVVVKGDVQGSVEALRGSLEKLSNAEVRVRTIHTGVGAVTESDVMLASASNAIILGFNVRPDASAKATAETENVDIRLYSVIYSAIDDIEAAMKGMLDPEFREVVLGHAEIRQIFKASGIGTIAGCMVIDGKITRTAKVRLVRDGRVIYDGTLESLKRFKDDAREVASGYECGMHFKNYNDIKENDRIEAYIMEEIPR